jgi:hypothetical protein
VKRHLRFTWNTLATSRGTAVHLTWLAHPPWHPERDAPSAALRVGPASHARPTRRCSTWNSGKGPCATWCHGVRPGQRGEVPVPLRFRSLSGSGPAQVPVPLARPGACRFSPCRTGTLPNRPLSSFSHPDTPRRKSAGRARPPFDEACARPGLHHCGRLPVWLPVGCAVEDLGVTATSSDELRQGIPPTRVPGRRRLALSQGVGTPCEAPPLRARRRRNRDLRTSGVHFPAHARCHHDGPDSCVPGMWRAISALEELPEANARAGPGHRGARNVPSWTMPSVVSGAAFRCEVVAVCRTGGLSAPFHVKLRLPTTTRTGGTVKERAAPRSPRPTPCEIAPTFARAPDRPAP